LNEEPFKDEKFDFREVAKKGYSTKIELLPSEKFINNLLNYLNTHNYYNDRKWEYSNLFKILNIPIYYYPDEDLADSNIYIGYGEVPLGLGIGYALHRSLLEYLGWFYLGFSNSIYTPFQKIYKDLLSSKDVSYVAIRYSDSSIILFFSKKWKGDFSKTINNFIKHITSFFFYEKPTSILCDEWLATYIKKDEMDEYIFDKIKFSKGSIKPRVKKPPIFKNEVFDFKTTNRNPFGIRSATNLEPVPTQSLKIRLSKYLNVTLDRVENFFKNFAFSIEPPLNRIHTADISVFEGLGIGNALYKSLIKYLGWATSNYEISSKARNVWIKLSKDEDFCGIIEIGEKGSILIFDKKWKGDFSEVITKFINYEGKEKSRFQCDIWLKSKINIDQETLDKIDFF